MKKLTLEEFIRKSVEINGPDHYDYSKVDYINVNTKVTIHCNIHNLDFLQSPDMHLYQKGGCPKCAIEASTKYKMKGKDHYIKMIIEKRGDVFDFSNVPENSTRTSKFDVICKNCGSKFISTFDSLLKYNCCRGCFPVVRGVIKTKEDFVNFCNEKFDFKYDYSKVEYKNNYTKVIVRCPKHDLDFSIIPSSHMVGCGCKKCASESISEKLSRDMNYYLDLFKTVHDEGEFYYTNSEYIRSHVPILIKCKNGHEFRQSPDKHARGAKCPYCLGRHVTTEDFILKSNIENGYRYTYENTEYVNNWTKVSVTCPKHGDFEVTPANHCKKGEPRGCPRCRDSHGELSIRLMLDKLKLPYKPQYTFDECKNILLLPFDFAVFNEDGTINCLIEMQGIQHYEAVCFGGISEERAQSNFNDTVFRDAIKKEFCKNNQINILYITYKELDRIEEILSHQFKGRF